MIINKNIVENIINFPISPFKSLNLFIKFKSFAILIRNDKYKNPSVNNKNPITFIICYQLKNK